MISAAGSRPFVSWLIYWDNTIVTVAGDGQLSRVGRPTGRRYTLQALRRKPWPRREWLVISGRWSVAGDWCLVDIPLLGGVVLAKRVPGWVFPSREGSGQRPVAGGEPQVTGTESKELSGLWIIHSSKSLSSTHPTNIPIRHWELDKTGQPTQRCHRTPQTGRFHHTHPEAEKTKRQLQKQAEIIFDEGKGLSTDEAAVPAHGNHQRRPPAGRSVAKTPRPESMAGHPGDGPSAPPLETPPIHRYSSLLLPG